jgi:hypothetical protein
MRTDGRSTWVGVGALSSAGTNIVYTSIDGSTWPFSPVAGSSTQFVSPAGLSANLVATISGSTVTDYILMDLSTRQLIAFDPSGDALSVTDRNGNSTTILPPFQGAGRALEDGFTMFTNAEGAQPNPASAPTNLSEAFIGSFNLTAIPLKLVNPDSVQVQFTVVNNTTVGSLIHLPGWGGNRSEMNASDSADQWIQDNSPGPLRETTQTITWTQNFSTGGQ